MKLNIYVLYFENALKSELNKIKCQQNDFYAVYVILALKSYNTPEVPGYSSSEAMFSLYAVLVLLIL